MMFHGSLIPHCFPLPICHLQSPAPWCPEIRAMLNQRPYVLSVFWLGVSFRMYFGEAENLSCRWHFQLQAFNSSLTAGGRQEREDDGL